MALKKRFLSLLFTAVVLMACAVPGAQAKSEWLTDPEEVALGGAAEPHRIIGAGILRMTTGLGFTTGPMNIAPVGNFWNGPVHGEGEISEFMMQISPIATSLPGCTASAGAVNLPWNVLLETEAVRRVEIQNMTIVFTYNAICQMFGIPETVPVKGTLTGEFDNTDSCLVFENSGNMAVEPSGPKVTVDGSICIGGEEDEITAA